MHLLEAVLLLLNVIQALATLWITGQALRRNRRVIRQRIKKS